MSSARLGPKAFTSLTIGHSRPLASNSGSRSHTITRSGSTKTHQTYRQDLHGTSIMPPEIRIANRNKGSSATRARVSSSFLPETQDLRYQLRLVFRHASKYESKRYQPIQGSEIIILESSILDQVICGEYDGWTKFLKYHILFPSWLWQEFVKLIPYDQSKEINRKVSLQIAFFLSSIVY